MESSVGVAGDVAGHASMCGMTTSMTSRNLLTRDEVAERLRCSITTVSRMLSSGELYSVRIQRRVLIPEEALDAWVRGEKIVADDPMRQPEAGTWPPTGSLLDSEGDA